MALQTPRTTPNPAPAASPASAPVSAAARAAALGFADSHGSEDQLQLAVGLWGAGLSGKTTHAMSFPNPVVFNFDPTTTSITKQQKRVPFVQVRDTDQMFKLAQAAAQGELTALVRAAFPDEFADYVVETVITDSSTFQAAIVEEKLDTMTFASARGADDTRARYQAKLVMMNKYYRLLKHARERAPNKESYMHVVTIHEKLQLSEKGDVVSIKADITGDYNRLIFQQNDANFFCELQLAEVLGDKSGKIAQNTRPTPVVRSVPHTKWHNVVNDRVGGLGRYGQLPPIMHPPPNSKGGLWSVLEEHWLGNGK